MKYLIDANLPYRLALWNTKEYIHVFDLDKDLPDSQIWKYAMEHNLTIVTKDSDFSDKILTHTPPPKVVHFKTGNMKMKLFHAFINNIWEEVLEMNTDHKLVNVFNDRMEGIN